jgi:hypothetical protein
VNDCIGMLNFHNLDICADGEEHSFLRFNAKTVCTAFSRTSYKIVPLTSLNKYLYNDTSETEVNVYISVNNGRKNSKKRRHCDFR